LSYDLRGDGSVTIKLLRRDSAERPMISQGLCATIGCFLPQAVAQKASERAATGR
jgi:hypothetical protein